MGTYCDAINGAYCGHAFWLSQSVICICCCTLPKILLITLISIAFVIVIHYLQFEARDFSHLPPEQRKKRLLKKVEELKANLDKSMSDMTAMEKMKGIYEQNPALGDAQQVAQRIVECRERIDQISAEIDEFKGYLDDAHNKTGVGDVSSLSGEYCKCYQESLWIASYYQHNITPPPLTAKIGFME
jgi:hypothetical protein